MSHNQDKQSGSGAPVTDSDVTIWLVISILLALSCTPPFGFISGILGVLAYIDFQRGRYEQAEQKLRYTKLFAYIAVGIAALIVIVGICMFPFFIFI